MTQLGSPATDSGPDSGGPAAVHGSRLARRRRVLLGVGIAAALLAVGGLIGASFVKSPQQLAADTAAPPATVTTAAVVSQILTSSVEMRGVIYPATQYDLYPSAPSATGSAGGSASGGSSGSGSPAPVYISKLDVAAGGTVRNGEQLAELDGEPLFALTGTVPAWRDLTPGETGPDVTELQQALASLGYYDDGDTAGYYGSATEYAVTLYYEHLAGIYLAVQASYEQQIVNANQQALNSAVQQYKAAYARELKKLPALLKTAKVNQFPKLRPTRRG